MGSPDESVVKNSINDIRDHMLLGKYLKVDEINIHIGGRYGDRETTKKRFVSNMRREFSREELNQITIENDELNYSLSDVLEVARELKIRVTYDLHHERCFRIGEEIDEERNFLEARKSWKGFNYQRIHLSSPRDGYTTASKSRPHSDYIEERHLPLWLKKYPDVHIDIEAKAKELAIEKLRNY
jgi:UV DNA damage endonuclease